MYKLLSENIMLLKIFPSLLFLFITSCSTFDARFIDSGHAKHPAVRVFLDFEKEVENKNTFEDKLKVFFSPKAIREIETKKGWYRLVYTSSFRALRDGSCEQISLIKKSHSHVLLSCKGPYKFKSPLGLSSNEKMHLKVNIRLFNGNWYLDKAGLTHTMAGGKTAPRSMGLKF